MLNFTPIIAKIQELLGASPPPGPTRGHEAAPDPMPLKKNHAVPVLVIVMLIACVIVETDKHTQKTNSIIVETSETYFSFSDNQELNKQFWIFKAKV